LRDAKVCRVEHSSFDLVAKRPQASDQLLEQPIPSQAGDVLDHNCSRDEYIRKAEEFKD
jgi:hypothetical protein